MAAASWDLAAAQIAMITADPPLKNPFAIESLKPVFKMKPSEVARMFIKPKKKPNR